MVEDEAEYCEKIANRDVAGQVIDACTEWLLNMHWLVVRQSPGGQGPRFGSVGGLGVRDNVVDIVRGTVARHSSSLGA